ncbi:hypothetical protein GW17_00022512 [Ensete ventricosum]|nr:hypothetical protein GW17_00022512 [Ensete ventricosum]
MLVTSGVRLPGAGSTDSLPSSGNHVSYDVAPGIPLDAIARLITTVGQRDVDVTADFMLFISLCGKRPTGAQRKPSSSPSASSSLRQSKANRSVFSLPLPVFLSMPLSQPAAAPGSSPIRGGKRRRGRSKGSRAKKKQKRLDSICDAPGPATPAGPQSPGDDRALIRRSSRVRRAPAFLDSSPAPACRRKKRRLRDSPIRSGSGVGGGRRRKKKKRRKRRDDGDDLEEGNPVSLQARDGSPTQETKMSEEEAEDWRSRLRSRVGKRKGKSLSFEEVTMRKEKESVKPVTSGSVLSSQAIRSSRRGRSRVFSDEVNVIAEETRYQGEVLSSNDHEDCRDKASHEEELKVVTDSPIFSEPNQEILAPLPSEEVKENADRTDVADKEDLEQSEEGTAIPNLQLEDVGPGNCLATSLNEHVDDKPVKSEDILKEDKPKPSIFDDKIARKHVKEGRRCGLCGGGTDGRPPKRLVHESSGSDNEAYEGSSASEEPNYDVWDGFGDEPGWLGRLLGPINDRFGIPRIWVHQHCAVWSPEVRCMFQAIVPFIIL